MFPRQKIIFGRSYLPISIGIQVITVCRWSHVGWLVEDTVYEARGGFGVMRTPLDEFKARYRDVMVREIYVPNPNYMADLMARVGKGYDGRAFWSIGIERLSRGLLRLDWDDLDADQCAEYIAKTSGLFGSEYGACLTPKDILKVSHAVE